jgi:hypothetical protein
MAAANHWTPDQIAESPFLAATRELSMLDELTPEDTYREEGLARAQVLATLAVAKSLDRINEAIWMHGDRGK